MKISVNLFVCPVGTSKARFGSKVDEVVAEFEKRGLTVNKHGHGLNIDGDWKEIFNGIKNVVKYGHQKGAKRIVTHIQMHTEGL